VTVTRGDHDEPLIPLPEMTLPSLRSAVSIVAPSQLPQFFEEMQQAFTQDADAEVRAHAIREAGDIVRAAHREIAA
jgi:hypothetical protein